MNINLQVGTNEVIVLSITLILLVGIVIFLLVRLNQKIEEVKRPRFGFLGKTLTYSTLAVVVGVGLIIFLGSNISNLNNTGNKINANNNYSVDFQASKLDSTNSSMAKLVLSAVVLEDGIVWGDHTYDLTWTFQGTNSVITPQVETNRGKDSPSYLTVNLPKDLYEVTVKAKSDVSEITKTKEIDLR